MKSADRHRRALFGHNKTQQPQGSLSIAREAKKKGIGGVRREHGQTRKAVRNSLQVAMAVAQPPRALLRLLGLSPGKPGLDEARYTIQAIQVECSCHMLSSCFIYLHGW